MPTLAQCVYDQVSVMAEALCDRTTFEDWYWNGAELGEVLGVAHRHVGCSCGDRRASHG